MSGEAKTTDIEGSEGRRLKQVIEFGLNKLLKEHCFSFPYLNHRLVPAPVLLLVPVQVHRPVPMTVMQEKQKQEQTWHLEHHPLLAAMLGCRLALPNKLAVTMLSKILAY